jgi:hypothetical protein
MDVIVIGKKAFNRNEAPHVVYCGQSKDEAVKAIADTAGQFPYVYEVSPLEFRRIAVPAAVPVSVPAPAPEPKTETAPKKKATK